MSAVRLPRAADAAIRAHAEAAWPEECCGLLSGAGLSVAAAHPCRNLAAEPAHAFEVDPQAWLDLRAALARAGRGETIIGCYHAHPDGTASPSARDLAEAWEPGFLWLVVAVAGGRARAMTAHVFEWGGEGAPGAPMAPPPGARPATRRFRPLALEIV
jgi:proteasome lid subunit RPN8/RPN11